MATPKNPNPFPITRPARSSLHPSHLPPPSLFWSTLSVTSTLASIISLCFINSFNSLSYFYTIPIIFLLLYSTSHLYPLLFSNLHHPPQPQPSRLKLFLIDLTFNILRIVLCYYPEENSLQVALFFVAVSVNAMAITKLLKGWKKGNAFQHLMFVAMVRVLTMSFLHRCGFIGYLYGFMQACLWVLFLYFEISEGL